MPSELRGDMLPTKLEIYNHFLYLSDLKCGSGEWQHNTDLSLKAKCVRDHVATIWDRTGIPHYLHDRIGEKRIHAIIQRGKKLSKVAMERRSGDYRQELEIMFDAALCKHSREETCNCQSQSKVRKPIVLI